MRAIPKALPESALDIGMPDRRAKRCTPPRAATPPKPSAYSASQDEREKWMREKQERKRRNAAYERDQLRQASNRPSKRLQQILEETEAQRLAPIEGKREAQLLEEAAAEIRQRRRIEAGLRGTVNKEGPDTTEEG